MSGSKHTPGPWTLQGRSICATGSVDTWAGPVSGSIAFCEETEQMDSDGRTWTAAGDAVANARLMAAAPDLLSALKMAVGALEFSRDYHADLGNEDQAFAQDQLDAANKAIAKAEGRE